jgi:hypothetical protein
VKQTNVENASSAKVAAGVEMLERAEYWLLLRTSTNNGKVRFEGQQVQVTASLGKERLLFLRAGDRRLHYSGQVRVRVRDEENDEEDFLSEEYESNKAVFRCKYFGYMLTMN